MLELFFPFMNLFISLQLYFAIDERIWQRREKGKRSKQAR
jgi:hypothetical protein